MLHVDASKALEDSGERWTFISAGRFEVEGNPAEPLGDEARAETQREVDRIAEQFVGDVARARGMTRDAVATVFGRGRVVDAREAVRRGMADEVATPEDALPRLIESDGAPRARANLDRPLERGLTARQEMWLAEYDREDAERKAALRKMWETA